MTERIKLKEDDFVPIDSGFDTLVGFSIDYDKRSPIIKQILDDTRSMDYYRQWYKEHFPDAGDSLPLLKDLFEYRSKLAKHNEKEFLNRVHKLQKIEELIKKESDLDLHPDAEELDINRRIMGILDKFKKILEEKQ